MIEETINEQNRNSNRPYYDRSEKCGRVTFPDRDAEEGDLLYVASEYARTGLYFPYYTMNALGGRGHDHYFEGGYWNRCWMIRKASPFSGLRNTIQSRK